MISTMELSCPESAFIVHWMHREWCSGWLHGARAERTLHNNTFSITELRLLPVKLRNSVVEGKHDY